MKKLFLMIAILVSMASYSQKITYNLDAPKTEAQVIGKSSMITADYAQYKNKTYKVYKTQKGRLFIVYPNKKKGYSRKYITQ